jgi:hypothetical protein
MFIQPIFACDREHNGNGNNGSKICLTNLFSVIPGQMPLPWFRAYLAWYNPCHPQITTTAKFSFSIFPAVLGLPQSQTFLYYIDKGISSMKVCSPTFIHMWLVYTFMFVRIQRIFKIILDINWIYDVSELKAPGLKIALPYFLNGLPLFAPFSMSYNWLLTHSRGSDFYITVNYVISIFSCKC